MLVADDYLLECGGRFYRRGLVLFFVSCASLGVPLAWHKTAGGDTLIWVGFELLLRPHSIGISERRAEWFARWTEKIASSATVHMGSFEEGLGRVVFVAGALEHERPFLGPLLQISYYASQGCGAESAIFRRFYTPLSVLRDPQDRHYLCGARYTTAECITKGRCTGELNANRNRWLVSGA